MERSLLINSFVCSLFLLNFAQGAVFPPIETKCPPDCSVVSCLKPTCKGGLFTPECECCPKCLSQQDEKCGVPEKTYGKCDINLYCEKPAGSNQGLCAACPLFKCKPCDNGYELDARGCRTCKCKCPTSSCLFIKCAYGVIKTTDVNGCEQCSCKPPIGCTHDGKSFNVGETRYEQCNQCTCSGNNVWACTEKGCPTGFCYFLGNQIPAATSFFDGCNRCTCIVKSKSEYGVLRCTKKACPGCPQIFCTKKCRFGFETSANGCQQCQCRPIGYCEFEGQKFTLRSQRYENCNKCVCTLDGWKCQEKTCPGGVCYKNGKTIADGVSFFDGCNTCTCLASDKSKPGAIACTKRACPRGCQPNLVCFEKCPNGYAKNRFGCSICKCAPKCVSNCPVLVCAGPSIERYIDDAGCEQCRCLPVGGLSCPLYPAPAPDTKSVKCGLESFPCPKNECESDAECPYGKKCCVSGGVQGSPLKCITPVPFSIGK